MGRYDFDSLPDRRNTNCLKHDFVMERKGRDDLLSLWVADMDFYMPQEIVDEIHGDFVFQGNHFTPIATLGEEVSQRVIVCTSSSKTYNIAGLQNANIIIPNQKLRENYRRQIAKSGYSNPNTFGLVACMSAYEKGEPWLDDSQFERLNIACPRCVLEQALTQLEQAIVR